jgi:hypothetical protein
MAPVVRLPKARTLPKSHVIWIAGNRKPIPRGFEVHHDNENRRDDSFDNLFLLSTADHKKLHRLRRTSIITTANQENQENQEDLADVPF